MTVSDELRRMLDELGVEHRDVDETIGDGDGSDPYGQKHTTRWFHHGMECTFAHSTHDDGWEETVFDGGLATDFTPAQAIEATLGSEPDDAAMVRLHERMNAALLEYERAQGIEKRDGDGEVVVPFVAEMHRLIEEAATLGRGTCHIEVHDNLAETEGMGEVWLECDECHWQMPLEPSTPRFKFCPNCGRRIEVGK